MSTRGTCKRCLETRWIRGHGWCATCYRLEHGAHEETHGRIKHYRESGAYRELAPEWDATSRRLAQSLEDAYDSVQREYWWWR